MNSITDVLRSKAGKVLLLFILIGIAFIAVNPVGYNQMGYRQVVETPAGNTYVIFKNGLYFHMPFADITDYPNVITIAYVGKNDPLEGTITVKNQPIEVQFRDGTKADVTAIARFRLPQNEPDMLKLHSEFRSHTKLATSSIAPYAKECLKASAQLMESETVYTGGRSQLSGDWQDQLENGMFIIDTKYVDEVDSLTQETERVYINEKRMAKNEEGVKIPVRINSDIDQFGINIASANLMDIDYEDLVDEKIKLKVEASTREAVSKQELVTARQEALTAAEKGKQRLIEIEYEEKQKQTKSVVSAETQVKLAEQDKAKQAVALEAARLEAQKIKALADAEAYAKRKVMDADGALEKKLSTYEKTQQMWATAFQNYKGSLVPTYQHGGGNSGGASNNAAQQFMELMTVKAAKDLQLDMKVKQK